MSYNAQGRGERILKDAVAAAQAHNEAVANPTLKKISVLQISQEFKAEWLFGKTYWKPQRIAIDWPEILHA